MAQVKEPEMNSAINKMLDEVFDVVRQMKEQIDSCSKPHKFEKFKDKPSGRLIHKCAKCGIQIPSSYIMWYNFGLKDALTDPKEAAKIVDAGSTSIVKGVMKMEIKGR